MTATGWWRCSASSASRSTRVWVLVSPGNPLKDHTELAPLADRVAATGAADGPSAHPGDRLRGGAWLPLHLRRRWTIWWRPSPACASSGSWAPTTCMSFHRWERWEEIAATMPMAVYARPGATYPGARAPRRPWRSRHYRLPEDRAETLAGSAPPAWVYLRGRHVEPVLDRDPQVPGVIELRPSPCISAANPHIWGCDHGHRNGTDDDR